MNKIQTIIITIIISLVYIGCTSPSKLMQTWIGHTKAELYQSWGPPQSKTDDGQGGEILIYSNYVNMGQQPGQIYSNYYGGVSYTTPQQRGYSRTRMFYVNKSGTIYNWRWEGY
jgi:hypothetical protein